MSLEIGKKVKQLRVERELTLKELSEKTNLSTGFLSQLERGLTTVAIDSLENIAKALEVELSYFFIKPKHKRGSIVRSYEREIMKIDNSKFIYYQLTKDLSNKGMIARLVELLPSSSEEEIAVYTHEGEEFVYVLEGILTVFLENERAELYPGDSLHINSTTGHNWANYSNKSVKLVVVSTPNKYRE